LLATAGENVADKYDTTCRGSECPQKKNKIDVTSTVLHTTIAKYYKEACGSNSSHQGVY